LPEKDEVQRKRRGGCSYSNDERADLNEFGLEVSADSKTRQQGFQSGRQYVQR